MKILLDENLSPTLVQKLGALGIVAQHVAHLGKSGLSDPALSARRLPGARRRRLC
jgi:predicted nuclease of predicted toxin-antitoxin system